MKPVPVKGVNREIGWIRKRWGPLVRAARKEAGHTQSTLAKASGLGQQTISDIETGAVPMDTNHLEAICAALGREPEDILFPALGEISPFARDLLAVVENAPDPLNGALDALDLVTDRVAVLRREARKSEGG